MTGAPFDVGRVKRSQKRFRDRQRNSGHALECKKSVTHKQIGAAEASSLMDKRPKTGKYSSFK
jgi:hypothetical protein